MDSNSQFYTGILAVVEGIMACLFGFLIGGPILLIFGYLGALMILLGIEGIKRSREDGPKKLLVIPRVNGLPVGMRNRYKTIWPPNGVQHM